MIFNHDAGLTDKPYDDFLESSLQVEEALEGFYHLPDLAEVLEVPKDSNPKHISRAIVAIANVGNYGDAIEHSLTDVDRLDKACDAVVYAIGSMTKLGLDAQQITKALNIVMVANNAKLINKTVDSSGKLNKPSDFKGPEEALQKILDER